MIHIRVMRNERGAQFHIVKNHNGTHNVHITLCEINMLNTSDGNFIAVLLPSGLWSYLAFIL